MSRRHPRTPRSQTLSQHRLRDDSVARRIVASTGLAPPALVVEVGAGEGILTSAIVPHARRVIAVEQDRECYAALRQRFHGDARVQPVLGDFLALQLPNRPYHVVANVPYSATAQIMRKLLASARPPESAFLVMQREAAMRWTGDGGECVAALSAKLRFEFEIVLALRRQEFVPWPRVSSVLLGVRRRPRPLLSPAASRPFERFIERAFGRGGGSLGQNLGRVARSKRVLTAVRELEVDLDGPPSAVTFGQWLALFQHLEPHG